MNVRVGKVTRGWDFISSGRYVGQKIVLYEDKTRNGKFHIKNDLVNEHDIKAGVKFKIRPKFAESSSSSDFASESFRGG